MKNILRTAAVAVFALLTVAFMSPAFAQKNNMSGNVEQRIERMKKHLNLTDSQTEEVRTILNNAREQARRDRDTYSDKEARRNAMKSLREETRNKIKALLTPEQLKKMQEAAERRKKYSAF